LGLIAAGMACSNCLENRGKEQEAQRMRENMDRLQREVDELQHRIGTN
jgi:hypothetical protein